MSRRLRITLLGVFGAWVLSAAATSWATTPEVLPKELLFVGLTDGEWRVFLGGGAVPRQVRTASEPRSPAYSLQGRIAYVSDRGSIRELQLATAEDTVLVEATPKHAYTQLAYRPGTDELYGVLLHQGSSVDTDLVRVDRVARSAVMVSRQRSAQFEPTFTHDGERLVYSNVLCASECPVIIQELWSMEVVGGAARQLTLLNSVSRQASVDGAGRVLFASNKEGYYQLWRMDAPGSTPYRLTQASAIDESPVSSDAGDIFFVRRTADGSELMRMDAAGQIRVVALGGVASDVRDLRWGR